MQGFHFYYWQTASIALVIGCQTKYTKIQMKRTQQNILNMMPRMLQIAFPRLWILKEPTQGWLPLIEQAPAIPREHRTSAYSTRGSQPVAKRIETSGDILLVVTLTWLKPSSLPIPPMGKNKSPALKWVCNFSLLSTYSKFITEQLASRFHSQSDEEETEDGKDLKTNTKLNAESDEKAPVGSRRRSQETRHEDTKVMGVVAGGVQGW